MAEALAVVQSSNIDDWRKEVPGRYDRTRSYDKPPEEVPPHGPKSKSARNCTLQIFGSQETVSFPIVVSTSVGEIREILAAKLCIEADTLGFVQKSGCYTKVLFDGEEVATRTIVRGIKSFSPQRKEYPLPHAIIGAGHNALRQAMWFLEEKNTNFVMLDRRHRVGGTSWLEHANKWTKVQTELGTYHLNYSDQCDPPKGMSPWPSRDELLDHFQQVCDEWGISSYIRFHTDVKKFDVLKLGAEQSYNLISVYKGEDMSTTQVSSLFLFPGNLTNPKREEYKGEDTFGGPVNYGIMDECNYDALAGKDVAIIGMGAFAVENIRTCMEHHVRKVHLVVRRKNLCMPRMVSWWINGSLVAIPAGDVLRACEGMFKLCGDNPWEYWAVHSNEARTSVTIHQRARFGIGDIFFLSRYYGKTDVVIGAVKKLSHRTIHLDSGEKLEDVHAILKLLGFTAEWEVDRFLQLKELVGFWVNEDYRRVTISEFPTVNAQRFGGTSLSPGAIAWCYAFMHMLNFPREFQRILETGMLGRHRANIEKDEPAYIIDAKGGANNMIIISSTAPLLSERLARYDDNFKRKKQWGAHSMEEIQALAEEDWMRYCKMFKDQGDDRPFPPYPYPLETLKEMVERQDREGIQEMTARYARMQQ